MFIITWKEMEKQDILFPSEEPVPCAPFDLKLKSDVIFYFGRGGTRPLSDHFFMFMQFSGKIHQNSHSRLENPGSVIDYHPIPFLGYIYEIGEMKKTTYDHIMYVLFIHSLNIPVFNRGDGIRDMHGYVPQPLTEKQSTTCHI